MFLMISKKPKKTDRKRSARYKAKLKAKNKARRARVYQHGKLRRRALRPRASPRASSDVLA